MSAEDCVDPFVDVFLYAQRHLHSNSYLDFHVFYSTILIKFQIENLPDRFLYGVMLASKWVLTNCTFCDCLFFFNFITG